MRHKIVRGAICICALVLIIAFFSFKESKYTTYRASGLLDKYQSQLEKIVSYMINESPNGRYLKEASYEDSYLNCRFLPQEVKESMEIYFNKVAATNFASIYVLREDTTWNWGIQKLPINHNLVSFSIYMGAYAKDSETGNDMIEYQTLCYSDMDMDELQELLKDAVRSTYEVSALQENWYLVTER